MIDSPHARSNLPLNVQQRNRSPLAFFFVIAIVSITGVIANLPYRYVERGIERYSSTSASVSIAIRTEFQNSIAGFPLEISRRLYYRPDGEASAGRQTVTGSIDEPTSEDARESADLSTSGNDRPSIQTAASVTKRSPPGGSLLHARFSWPGLIGNVCFWMLMIGFVLALIFRPRPKRRGGKWHRIDEAVLPIVILIVPMTWLGWHQWRLSSQNRLVDRITKSGTCDLSTFAPAWIADSLPRKVIECMRQIRAVSLFEPDESLLKLVMDQPMLTGLELSPLQLSNYNLYDVKRMGEFASQPTKVRRKMIASRSTPIGGPASVDIDLASDQTGGKTGQPKTLASKSASNSWWAAGRAAPIFLSIRRGKFSNVIDEILDAHPQIFGLVIREIKINPAAAASMAALPNLKFLSLRGSRLPESGIPDPVWKKQVQSLTLPVGNYLEEDIRLENFDSLEQVNLITPVTRMLPGLVRLRIANANSLVKVSYDRLRRYEVDMRDLPKFEMFEKIHKSSRSYDDSPLGSSLSEFDRCLIRNCPNLQLLCIVVDSLKELDIRDAGGITKLELANYFVGQDGSIIRQPIQFLTPDQLLDEIGHCEQIESLKLTGLDLAGHDISSISQCPRLATLEINSCDVSGEQVARFSEALKLTRLDLGDTKLNDSQFAAILTKFPRLETLLCDASDMTRITLKSGLRLRTFRSPPLRKIQRFELLGESDLSSGVNVDHPLESLRIDHAPRLVGLAVAQSFPKDAILGGLRDLKYFAAGGKHIGDSVWDDIRACDQLQHLMIAYGGLSKRALSEIGSLKFLRFLSLPGSQTNDDVVAAWSDLSQLWSVDLSDCPIGPNTIDWLGKQSSLRFLALNRVDFSDPMIESLANLNQVTHLSIRDNKLSPQQLRRICQLPVDSLNISGCQLDPQHIAAITGNVRAKTLVTKQNGLKLSQWSELCEQNPSLRLQIEPSELTSESLGQVDPTISKRVISDIEILSQQEIRFSRPQPVAELISEPIHPIKVLTSSGNSRRDADRRDRADKADQADAEIISDRSDPNVVQVSSPTSSSIDFAESKRPPGLTVANKRPAANAEKTEPKVVQKDDPGNDQSDDRSTETPLRRITRFEPARSGSFMLKLHREAPPRSIVFPQSHMTTVDWLGGQTEHFRGIPSKRP